VFLAHKNPGPTDYILAEMNFFIYPLPPFDILMKLGMQYLLYISIKPSVKISFTLVPYKD
jgi:hypothetical protein